MKFKFLKLTAAAAAKSLQLYTTLCDPIPGILQARTLEWVTTDILLKMVSKFSVEIRLI